MTTAGNCEYVLDPDEPRTWGGSPGEQCAIDTNALKDGVWRCPHDAVEGEQQCLFHLPVDKKDNSTVTEAFIETVHSGLESAETGTPKPKLRFIGAQFGAFDLSGHSFEATEVGLDLSYATITGPLDWSSSTVGLDTLYCIGTRFESVASFENTTFGEYAAFLSASFDSVTNFTASTFQGEGDFRATTFEGDVSFRDARFGDRADFSSTTFGGKTTFEGVHIGGDAVFSRAECKAEFSLSSAEISGDADLMAMKVIGEAVFDSITIDGKTTLDFAEIEGVDSSGLL